MPNWKDVQEVQEQRRVEAQYEQQMREFGEDLGLIREEDYEPEPQRYDPEDPSKQNFVLGLLGDKTGGTQSELDAFAEQQALLREEAMERDIVSGLYDGSPLAQMTAEERQAMYRQRAKDREQTRWEREKEAKERAKRRAARRKELGL